MEPTPVLYCCAAPAWLRHMSHHAPQGVSPMAQKMSVYGINMAKLVLPRAGLHVITRCADVASHRHMADSIGHPDVPAPRCRQTPRSSTVVETTTTRRQVKRMMLEKRFWVQ